MSNQITHGFEIGPRVVWAEKAQDGISTRDAASSRNWDHPVDSGLLQKTQDNPRWGNHYIGNYETLDRLLTIQCIAKDLNNQHDEPTPNDLFAALHKEGTWLIHTSQGEQVIIKEDMEDFDDLVYSIHSNSPIEYFTQLHNMLNTEPVDKELQQHLDIFIKDAQFIQQLQQDQGNPMREGGGNVTTTT